jgi:V/A-type H+-transporting ATPase subunit D
MSRLRLKATPTKNNLLRLRKQLHFLHNGHNLLERKRELLTRLVYERIADYQGRKAEAERQLKEAYHWLAITQLRMGGRTIHQATLGSAPGIEVQILPRRALGIQYPAIQARALPPKPLGLLGIDPSFDEARKSFAKAALQLARLAEAEMALYRLISEQRKARKRVNALKYNIIPSYQEAIGRISELLEEEERSAIFAIKRLAACRT